MKRFVLCLAVLAAIFVYGHSTDVYASFIALQPGGSGSTDILDIGISPFSVSTIGAAGGGERLSGLDFQQGTNTLFASSGFQGTNPASLFTINPNTGVATLIGATGFDAVPGLVSDLDGTLFGSAATDPLGSADALITINPSTGAGTLVGLYGGGVDGIDGLAVDPTTGTLYGSGGSPNFDNLFTINKTTGAATFLGLLTEAGTSNALPEDLVGLTFDASGNLFGSLGSGDGRIISIDISNLEFTIVGDATLGGGSVSDIASPIPEPSTLLLFAVGVFGRLGIAYRRRKKTA